jgi:dihydrofolate synthase/folylpolyglutamate synthase
MLEDKNVGAFVAALLPVVDLWYPSGLDTERGLSADGLHQRMRGLVPEERMRCCRDVVTACRQARENAVAGDRIVVCGSFFTVAASMSGEV